MERERVRRFRKPHIIIFKIKENLLKIETKRGKLPNECQRGMRQTSHSLQPFLIIKGIGIRMHETG
jgi:hypothetical protein